MRTLHPYNVANQLGSAEPISARTVSDVAAYGALAVTYSGANARTGVYLPYREGVRMAGPGVARTGLGEGEDTRGGYCATCRTPEHDTCSLTPECPCCNATLGGMAESPAIPHGDRGEHPAELRSAIAEHLDRIGL